MKTFLLASLLFLSTPFDAAAQVEAGQVSDSTLFTVVDQMPEYPGGISEFLKYLQFEMKYPQNARTQGVEGTVFVNFVIERNGEITNVKTIKGISPECDAEAVRVVQGSKPWIPGQFEKKPVRVRFVLPIKFALAPKQKNKKG